MATRNQDPVDFRKSRRYGSFSERYPDYLSWLDGEQWILFLGEDIPADPVGLNAFRSALHYQSRELGLVLRTTLQTRDSKRVMIVQAE